MKTKFRTFLCSRNLKNRGLDLRESSRKSSSGEEGCISSNTTPLPGRGFSGLSRGPNPDFLSFLGIIATLALITYLTLSSYLSRPPDGFSLSEISSHRPFDSKWETHPLDATESQTLEEALNQKYRYFGCGGQCFAFFSEDGRYVLKFLKQKRYTPPPYLALVPSFLKYKANKILGYHKKLEKEFSSYKTAFEQLQSQTGVLYVHLNPTTDLQKRVTIVDPLNVEHTLALDNYDFLLQRRAQMVGERMISLGHEGNTQEIQQEIHSLLTLILTRCQKGYHDTDPNLLTNCGFLGTQAVKIDIGHFIPQEAMKERSLYRKALLESSLPFREWLKTQSPELEPCFDQALLQLLEEEESCAKPL